METPYFSRELRYKSPFGAVKAGESITFRLFLPADCSSACLLLQADGASPKTYDCRRTDAHNQQGFWWECRITIPCPGLYFYTFTFDTPFGHNTLTRGKGGASLLNTQSEPWQLTVYHPDFHTPDWLPGGVIYQIFPDRFYASGASKSDVPTDRFLYDRFEGQPAFENDSGPRRINQDYWGGDLKGIQSKLPYLQSLGVTCLYLNPIFEAHENHRYNTADYTKIDPLLGNEQDFADLCAAAHKHHIRILLDGVFSHTGSDSVYFNALKRYPLNGAANRPDSPYASWYTFTRYPSEYQAWWGISSLPEVRETEPSFLSFITGPEGIAARWMSLGADGWRLDVADELPDAFLEAFRQRVKAQNPQGLIIGEVWEDASNKISYGRRRSYLLGQQLDSVMNYPFMQAVIAFLQGGDSEKFTEQIMTLLEHYPPPAIHTLMNHLGTHDTVRLITALAGEPANGRNRAWQAVTHLTPQQRKAGEALVKLASLLQFTLPGVPCIYYGDELGMEGYGDPFNRAPMAWEPPSPCLLPWYRKLGALRAALPALTDGDFMPLAVRKDVVCYLRQKGKNQVLVAVNRGNTPCLLPLPSGLETAICHAGGLSPDGQLPPMQGVVLSNV